jgi:hypothetical protein
VSNSAAMCGSAPERDGEARILDQRRERGAQGGGLGMGQDQPAQADAAIGQASAGCALPFQAISAGKSPPKGRSPVSGIAISQA